MNMKDTLVMIIIVAALVVASFFAGRLTSPREALIETQRDTIVRIDTIHSEPIVKTEKVVDSIPYPVPYPVHHTDTLHSVDTVYLPRTQKYYKESEYEAWVSGYAPALDSINVFNRVSEIEIQNNFVTPRKRWGVGIQAGYGASFSNQGVVAAPYIGIGISYNLFSW